MTETTRKHTEIDHIIAAIAARRRFVLSSHSRPDGDSIGSQLAMAFALRALGKEVTVINSDAAPGPLMTFPGVPDIQIADHVSGEFDADTVQLSGVVRDNTVIRARSLDVKLSSERGKLQVIFGEAEQPAAGVQSGTAAEPTPPDTTGYGGVTASREASSPGGEPAFRPEPESSAGDDGNGWQRGGRRRGRGNRHSEPPPAVG
jgi:hypothetical protein